MGYDELGYCDKCSNKHPMYELQVKGTQALCPTCYTSPPAPVPAEPPPGLLMSMALRYDHGLGCPGYYDSAIFASSGITHAKRLDATLRTMRQLWEEVSGNGFYRPEKEAEYADMLGGIAGTAQSAEGE